MLSGHHYQQFKMKFITPKTTRKYATTSIFMYRMDERKASTSISRCTFDLYSSVIKTRLFSFESGNLYMVLQTLVLHSTYLYFQQEPFQ